MIDRMNERQDTRRRVTFWLGIGLVAAGLALIGYVGWQFFGTNIVAERRQQETVAELEEQWQQEPPTTVEGSRDNADQPAPADLGDASALIRIPRFGNEYVMPVLEGVADDALSRGFGHFVESAPAGGRGNYALAAHRVTHGEPLRDMPSLRPGDEVIVETRDEVFTYVLDTDPNELVVTFDDVWVVDDQPVNPDPLGVNPVDERRLITLTTCAELFHTDDRMIVFGHLVGAESKLPA
jgi:sortase A